MFVQCNVNQATDECATMHMKGWLFCWLSKHNCPAEFAQGLVQSLQKTSFYETIRVSEDVFFSLLYTAGDHKTAVVLGCDQRSSEGMSTFKRALQWAKLNELSLEIAPNITDYDEQTRHLIADLGLSTAHPAATKSAAPSTKQHVMDVLPATSSEVFPDLLLIIYNSPPMNKDAFVQSVLKSLHISIGSKTSVAAHQYNNAQTLETVLPFAIGLATRYLKEQSLELEMDRTVYEQFRVVSPIEAIQGYALAMFAKL